MATQLVQVETENGAVTLTQFWGGEQRGTCVQVNCGNGFVQLTRVQAEVLQDELNRWLNQV